MVLNDDEKGVELTSQITVSNGHPCAHKHPVKALHATVPSVGWPLTAGARRTPGSQADDLVEPTTDTSPGP